LRRRGSTRVGVGRALVREAASGKTREKQRAFSYTPIVRDRDNNRARRFRKSSKPPRKRSKRIWIPPGLL
jgi:hypothetical protein